MLNWDDPLAALAKPSARGAAQSGAPSMPPPPAALFDEPSDPEVLDSDSVPTQAAASIAIRPHDTARHVRPGQGVVGNADLMATAGAAPVVSPDPEQAGPETGTRGRRPGPGRPRLR